MQVQDGCILLIYFTIYSTHEEVKSVEERKANIGTRITFNDNTLLVCDSFNYYIGKTRNFLFIHHQKDKTTDAVPMDRIKQITFKYKN